MPGKFTPAPMSNSPILLVVVEVAVELNVPPELLKTYALVTVLGVAVFWVKSRHNEPPVVVIVVAKPSIGALPPLKVSLSIVIEVLIPFK